MFNLHRQTKCWLPRVANTALKQSAEDKSWIHNRLTLWEKIQQGLIAELHEIILNHAKNSDDHYKATFNLLMQHPHLESKHKLFCQLSLETDVLFQIATYLSDSDYLSMTQTCRKLWQLNYSKKYKQYSLIGKLWVDLSSLLTLREFCQIIIFNPIILTCKDISNITVTLANLCSYYDIVSHMTANQPVIAIENLSWHNEQERITGEYSITPNDNLALDDKIPDDTLRLFGTYLDLISLIRYFCTSRLMWHTLRTKYTLNNCLCLRKFNLNAKQIHLWNPICSSRWFFEAISHFIVDKDVTPALMHKFGELKLNNLKIYEGARMFLNKNSNLESIKVVVLLNDNKMINVNTQTREAAMWTIVCKQMTNLSHAIIDGITHSAFPFFSKCRVIILQNLTMSTNYLNQIAQWSKCNVIKLSNITIKSGIPAPSSTAIRKDRVLIIDNINDFYDLYYLFKFVPAFENSISTIYVNVEYEDVERALMTWIVQVASYSTFKNLCKIFLMFSTSRQYCRKLGKSAKRDNPSAVIIDCLSEYLDSIQECGKLQSLIMAIKSDNLWLGDQDSYAMVYDVLQLKSVIHFWETQKKWNNIIMHELYNSCHKFDKLTKEMNNYWQTLQD